MPRNPDRAFAFDEPYDFTDLVPGRNGYQHVHVVRHQMPFLDPAVLQKRQFLGHAAEILFQQSAKTLSSKLGMNTTWYLHTHLVCAILSSYAGMVASCDWL